MKKTIAISIWGWVLLVACSKQHDLTYQLPDNIYFDFTNEVKHTRVDSFFFSFALYPDRTTDTLYLPVRISGKRVSADRWFKIKIVDAATTAIAGTHYKALDTAYRMPADSGTARVPVILFGTDPALLKKSVTIKLQIIASGDLLNTFPALDTAKITFSNRLEQPAWWVVWRGELGEYSRIKYELFIRTSGTVDLPLDQSDWQSIPQTLYFIRRFRAFLVDPINRAVDYEDQGYAIGKDTSGNFYFYNKGNNTQQYPLEYNAADGKYYFRDENGNRIVPQ
ncbi:DUF4843 domain-containing protein [Chitinophaga sp. 22321]|uniref:DUF4843 domain-containing protein n=1 Tax=Chitinophaga hostae TaxID=2831022 RepID=A0ABS5J8E4_9BACT|nr:DUF4843 domain-containing protein [Chitinophaga hostae]MBS0031492.1 DUF4843 domain-containing protein [Chitinophaga hostae]